MQGDLVDADHRSWWPGVARACHALGLPTADVEDCYQAALVAYLELGPGERAGVREPRQWLASVARRRGIDLLRAAEAAGRAGARVAARERCPTGDVADAVANAAEARWLVAQLNELPLATRRAVWELSTGATAAEAAERLGTSRRSVESHRYRARRHIASVATAG